MALLTNGEIIIKTSSEQESFDLRDKFYNCFAGNKFYIDSDITLCTLDEYYTVNPQLKPENGDEIYGVLITYSNAVALDLSLLIINKGM